MNAVGADTVDQAKAVAGEADTLAASAVGGELDPGTLAGNTLDVAADAAGVVGSDDLSANLAGASD